jgi:hypothetical protein
MLTTYLIHFFPLVFGLLNYFRRNKNRAEFPSFVQQIKLKPDTPTMELDYS